MLKTMLRAAVMALVLSSGGAFGQDGESRFLENETIESRLGTFTFEKGFPTPETTKALFDIRLAYRAVEVIQQNTFGASNYRMRRGYADMGAGKPNQVLVWKNLMDAKSELLTANNTTVYALTYLDLKTDGPTVVIAPPEVLGFADDMWMRYIGDIGKAGPDKGEGGKFLFLPPGYEGDVPDGYYVMSSKTYGVWMIMRGSVENGTTDVANERFEQLQVYPLADAENPEPTELIDATGMEMYTVHSENYELLEELGALVEEEHPDALDGAQKFLLASIGMEFGKPFAPTPEKKAILKDAAKVGAALLRSNLWEYNGASSKYYYEDRKWWNPFVGGLYTFDPNGFVDFDAQAMFAAYATGVTPAMAGKNVGVGSQYLAAHTDATGTPLDGAKTYKLTVPADIPINDFWSVTVYDSASRSMMHTSQAYPALGTYDDVATNDDGAIDLYFGPKAPEGHEANWVETDPAKGWTTIFRLYGPLEPYYDQSWKLNDIELVK
jgi:hypothetical protein